MLRARSIPYVEGRSGAHHVLLVEEADYEAARVELAAYESENANWPPPTVVAHAAPGARWGVAAYLAVVGVFHIITAGRAFGIDYYERGASVADKVIGAEPWRAVTALLLHSGPVHVWNNLLFGALFLYSAAYNLGGGVTCLAMVVAGALGNGTNALMQDPMHASIGASTAVFAAVGLLGGSEWRRRRLLSQRRLRVAAPIVMALCILAFHGIPEVPGRVDVMAHVTGFAWGVVLGVLLPMVLGARIEDRRTQAACGIAAAVVIAASWTGALAI